MVCLVKQRRNCLAVIVGLGGTVPKCFRMILIAAVVFVFPLTVWAQEDGEEDVEVTIEDVWLDADFSGYVYDLRTVNYDLPFAIGDAINGNIIISGIPNLCGVQDPAIPWVWELTFYDDLPTITINQTDTEQGYELLQYPRWEEAEFEPLWVRISFMDLPGFTEFRQRVWISISWGYKTQENVGPGWEFGVGAITLAPPSLPGLPPTPQELFAGWGAYHNSLDNQDWAVKVNLDKFPWWQCNSGIFCEQKAGQDPCSMCTTCLYE